MNQRKFEFGHATVRALACGAVVATAAAAFAASPAATNPVPTTPAATTAVAAPSVTAAKGSDPARIEARIKDMHTRLKITAPEEDQWTKVADVMRDNARKMDEMNNVRLTNAKTMNAVDDLNSYGEVVNAHADEIKKFAAAFTPLYASMSDAQKAGADELFRQGSAAHKAAPKKS